MPPFHNRSTGAWRIAFINSAGVMVAALGSRPSARTISGVSEIALAERLKTPPPDEISSLS